MEFNTMEFNAKKTRQESCESSNFVSCNGGDGMVLLGKVRQVCKQAIKQASSQSLTC